MSKDVQRGEDERLFVKTTAIGIMGYAAMGAVLAMGLYWVVEGKLINKTLIKAMWDRNADISRYQIQSTGDGVMMIDTVTGMTWYPCQKGQRPYWCKSGYEQ